MKQVALTFDDGPDPKTTTLILDVLQKFQIKASFMIWGQHAKKFPEIVKREFNDGHAIGNHTFSHTSLLKLDNATVMAEIMQNNQVIKEITGEEPEFCRPPYGDIDPRISRLIDLPSIKWSLDSQDWLTHSGTATIERIKAVQDGDIILMHDIQVSTATSIEDIILMLRKEGFECVTVPELFGFNLGKDNLYFSKSEIKKMF